MDNIHQITSKRLWISQNITDLKELIKQRRDDVSKNNLDLGGSSSGQPKDLSEEKLAIEVEKFVKENDHFVKPCFLFNATDERVLVDESDCKLKTYSLQLDHARRMISDRAYKIEYLSKLKTTRQEMIMRHLALLNRVTDEVPTDQNVTEDEMVTLLVVQIWQQPSKEPKIRLEKEALFRSDQCLTDLRDQFKCQKDYSIPVDLSKNPEQSSERHFQCELFKSGFFLIHETIYNDMRDNSNIDLSSSIIDWASKPVITIDEDGKETRVSKGVGPFEGRKMEDCKFEDLKFRLGCPYLYLHQGDCEHLFTISDIRYVPNNLKLQTTKFPFVTATALNFRADNPRCYMCQARPSHWYTRENNRLPVDPFLFCEDCFYSFNYDKDKKKIGEFKAYLYTSKMGIPDSVMMRFSNRDPQQLA